MIVTHVDDLLCACLHGLAQRLLSKTMKKFHFAKWSVGDFVFCGRELSQRQDGIYIKMEQYAKAIQHVTVSRERRSKPESPLNKDEEKSLRKIVGELSWLSRQLRIDLAFQVGQLQRCFSSPCVADLLLANVAAHQARRDHEFTWRVPRVDLADSIVVVMADAGHAKGSPESDEIKRYRSIGGHILFLTDKNFEKGNKAMACMMGWKSASTQRVCRSTLAAEASHLADSLEASE